MSNIEYNPSLNDKVNGQLGDLNVGIQIPLSSIKTLFDETPPIPPVPPAPYKVYTALVTQSGTDDPQAITSALLTIGVTYEIVDIGGSGWDFTNVGAPNNDIGTKFVATGTTPNSWGIDGQLGFNSGAPVVNVLENTIGNIWFTYAGAGEYRMGSNSLFTSDKTVSLNDQTRCLDSGNNFYNLKITNPDPSQINITVLNDDLEGRDDRLTSKLIEIRVYN
jgi:hypothetical protein